jgi:hypothetical protein
LGWWDVVLLVLHDLVKQFVPALPEKGWVESGQVSTEFINLRLFVTLCLIN